MPQVKKKIEQRCNYNDKPPIFDCMFFKMMNNGFHFLFFFSTKIDLIKELKNDINQYEK